jgi:hypothetical protein
MSEARGAVLATAEFEPWPPAQCAFGVPDTECDGWSTPDFAVRAASIRGAGHRFSRKPRQDSARLAVHEASGAVVFAVADGASEAVDSHRGAEQVCRAAVERLLHLLSLGRPLDLDGVAHHAAERLRRLGAPQPSAPAPTANPAPALAPAAATATATATGWYASTLVAGVVQADSSGPKIELLRVGDSGAWLLDRATGAYHALFGANTGSDTALVSDATMPLPYVPESVEAVVEHLTASEILLVGTDGFGDPLGDGTGPVGALFARHLAVPPTPLRLAQLLDFSRETFDDDRTLVAVWPGGSRGTHVSSGAAGDPVPTVAW